MDPRGGGSIYRGWTPSFGHIQPKVSWTSPDWMPVNSVMALMNPGPAVSPLPILIFATSVALVWYETDRTGVMTAAVPAAAISLNLPDCGAEDWCIGGSKGAKDKKQERERERKQARDVGANRQASQTSDRQSFLEQEVVSEHGGTGKQAADDCSP